MKQPDVRADHVLDRVEHGGIVHDLVDPGEQEMRLEVMAFAEFLPLRRLEALHRAPVAPRLIGAERIDRINKALAVIMRDLRVGEFFAHGCAFAVIARSEATKQSRAMCSTPWIASALRASQ